MTGATVAMRLASRLVSSLVPAGRGARRRGPAEVDIATDRNSRARPRLTLGLLSTAHAAIHAQSALMPLVYAAVVVEFGLTERDIGIFIAITTAVGGTMQLAYGFLTRIVARPILLGGGQLVFAGGLLLSGLAQSIGQLLAPSASPGSGPARSIRSATQSSPTRTRRSGAGSRSARTS